MPAPQFVCLVLSPWSERVKFALKLSEVQAEVVPYTPFIDEPWLRIKLRAGPWERVSVPVFFVPGQAAIQGSIPIAQWLSSASGNKLAMGDAGTLAKVEAAAEMCLQAGRYASLCRMIEDRVLDREAIPGPLRALPDWMNTASSVLVYKMLRTKYRQPQWTSVEALRALLQAGGGKSFSGQQVTMCDVVAASALVVIKVPQHDAVAAIRRLNQNANDPLVPEFSDLFAWMEELYQQHR
jgi:glutathione S-transferase